MGLKFSGVVKTDTRKFPMQALGSVEMETRGERHTYVSGRTSENDGYGMARLRETILHCHGLLSSGRESIHQTSVASVGDGSGESGKFCPSAGGHGPLLQLLCQNRPAQ
jgi:hypothetical protein